MDTAWLTGSPIPFPPPLSSSVGSSPVRPLRNMQRPTRHSREARLQASSLRTSRSRPVQPIVSDSAEDPSNAANASCLFSGSRDFVVNGPIIYSAPGVIDIVAQGMKALSKRVIKGATYDSSLRDPPPQCHPGTRVQLIEKIIVWFRNNGREKALLWLNGPAGVGKSAVVQTVAESLAESNSVGATLFFSRLNDRKDPQRVFITIAFQLATVIPAYRIYITERIALDPSLLDKGMKEQFRIFITEPFGNKRIGDGEGPWAVLLDGLDECEGIHEQSRIVQLISEFVLKFPGAPLVWAIASRPEPHITATFNDEAVASSHWSEYVPVDSTQACRDVEHYLDASFKAMQKQFPHIPSNWPSETQFLKLANGALGLFAFARTAVRFMEDPDHANPVPRLNLLISIIDHLDIKVIDDHPFALLDALYTQILTFIPPSVWCTTKRLLGFIICRQSGDTEDGLSYPLRPLSRTLMGASIIFGLELSVMYGSLHKLHSVLSVPGCALRSNLVFFHASFGDFLTDRARSKNFYIDRGESVDDITRCLFQLYLDKPWVTNWAQYTPQFSTRWEKNILQVLKEDVSDSVHYIATGELRSKRGMGPFKSQQHRLESLDALRQINLADIYTLFGFRGIMAKLLIQLWNKFGEELESTGHFKEVPLRKLNINHLDCGSRTPIFFFSKEPTWYAGFSNEVQRITSKLRGHQLSHPERPVLLYGSSPEKKIAIFEGTFDGMSNGYFCFPYPY